MIQILQADARHIPLADESVDCVVTSPPYWGLRDYGVERQLGLERLHDCLGWARGTECDECHVCAMRRVFREVHRVLKPTGTLWMNYGDCYATGAGKVRDCPGGGQQGRAFREKYWGKHADIGLPPMTQPNRMPLPGLKPKDLCGMAWRLAFALQADGWWLRSDIIWHKRNPMPESTKDRPTKAHEYLFLLAKSERYHFDQEAWKEPASPNTHDRHGKSGAYATDHVPRSRKAQRAPFGWDTGAGSHDALKHNTRSGRKRAAAGSGVKNNDSMDDALKQMPAFRNRRSVWSLGSESVSESHFATFPQSLVEPCILAGCPADGVVLDPFSGSGTTLVVANRLGRSGIGLELNPEYIEIARRRVFSDQEPTMREKQEGQKLIEFGPRSLFDKPAKPPAKTPKPKGPPPGADGCRGPSLDTVESITDHIIATETVQEGDLFEDEKGRWWVTMTYERSGRNGFNLRRPHGSVGSSFGDVLARKLAKGKTRLLARTGSAEAAAALTEAKQEPQTI